MGEEQTLPKVIGTNARQLRLQAGVTLDQVAAAADRYGVTWSTGRVGDLESGRVAATVPTLLVVALSLGSVLHRRVRLSELVRHDGPVRINDSLTVDGNALGAALDGDPLGPDLSAEVHADVHAQLRDPSIAVSAMEDVLSLNRRLGERFGHLTLSEAERRAEEGGRVGLAETRVAKDLGIDTGTLTAFAWHMWRRPFAAERDHRAGPKASPQKRGQITRQLKEELRAAIEDVTDGDDQ